MPKRNYIEDVDPRHVFAYLVGGFCEVLNYGACLFGRFLCSCHSFSVVFIAKGLRLPKRHDPRVKGIYARRLLPF